MNGLSYPTCPCDGGGTMDVRYEWFTLTVYIDAECGKCGRLYEERVELVDTRYEEPSKGCPKGPRGRICRMERLGL